MALTRDQMRAKHAYACAAAVPPKLRADYKALADGFGAFVLKNGLVAALAFVQRTSGDATALFLDHLAGADVPGLAVESGDEVFGAIRDQEDVSAYMLATRELLAYAVWLRRACQATFT